MPRVFLIDKDQEVHRLEKRMDRFDSVVTEYLRRTNYTVNDLAFQLGIDKSTLWRYRKRPKYFSTAPFGTITKALKIAGCTTESLRYICGL